ncbi:hypothetical protein RHGRI_006540 [Rhododendron griersonianum]|uniref:Haloacid dehalogenase-like hydrolase domain-containing protein 3 n=1 Tax=Rhododendron griersonianum TaxID=479676 RepID=A0AAV6KV07_9ERIC|nr:hypothetical protein RHGRI_006540 [Rhododendron griersonianum]
MATTMAKISKVAGRLLSHKLPRPISRSGSCGNGVRAEFQVDRFGVSGGSFYSSSAVPVESDLVGSRLFGLKDYEDYRRVLYGGITYKALLVDAVGTLVVPSQPMAQIYRQIGEKYGVEYSEAEILNRYRWAYEQPWGRSRLRPMTAPGHPNRPIQMKRPGDPTKPNQSGGPFSLQHLGPGKGLGHDIAFYVCVVPSHVGARYVNDGKPFWQYIVSSSTGCSDTQYFEELYNYYTTEKAWHLCDPDAEKVFKALRTSGVKLAVVSNFDTRLRPLLRALNCDHWFDAMAVSAEVEAEKPNPTIFLKACELLGVKPEDAVHVGDDRRNDIWGARGAGCDAWLWGSDVQSFKEHVLVVFVTVLHCFLRDELITLHDAGCSEDRSPGLNKDYSSPCNSLSSNFIV